MDMTTLIDEYLQMTAANLESSKRVVEALIAVYPDLAARTVQVTR
jgi:hypothetical protein